MTDHERIPVRPEAAEAARAAKGDDETWSDYVLRCADAEVPQKWTEAEVREVARDAAREAIQEVRR